MSNYRPKYIRRSVHTRTFTKEGWILQLKGCWHRIHHPARVAGKVVRRPVCWACNDDRAAAAWTSLEALFAIGAIALLVTWGVVLAHFIMKYW